MYGLNKYMIDINIETLAGTTFSLKVSPLESVQSVKAKIQRHEGIPISHQHLVWQSNELEDKCSLNDYNIPNGATIRMVLALRGGPINTRRLTTEDTLIRDVSDLMEIHEDSNLWNNDSSHSSNKHVTLLLFRDGDHLNLLRVIDRGDAPSPISGAMSAASMYVPYDDADHDALGANNNLEEGATDILKSKKATIKLASKRKKSANNENQKTKEKMQAIKNRLNQTKKEYDNQQIKVVTAQTITNDDQVNSKSTNQVQTDQANSKPSKKSSTSSTRPLSNVNINVKIKKSSSSNAIATQTTQDNNSTDRIKDANSENLSKPSLEESVVTKIKQDVNSSDPKYVYFDEDGEYEEDGDDEDITDEDECYDEEYLEDDEYDEEDDDEEENDEDDYDDEEDEDDEAAQEEEDDDQDETVSKFNQEQYYANLSQSANNLEGEYEGDRVVGDDEENYDEDENENELLLNKSEFLINEDHQTTNSPSSGLAGADLMAIMMMTVNSDQFSLNGVPSSLATTALPTIQTPLYTDNENFVIPYSASGRYKNKYLKGISKNTFDGTLSSKMEYVKNRKKAASKVPKTENEDLEENNETKLEMQKVKSDSIQTSKRNKQRRKKRLLKEQQQNLEPQHTDNANPSITKVRRNRKRYELHQITSFSPTTILVKTVSLDNGGSIRKKYNQKRIRQPQEELENQETKIETSVQTDNPIEQPSQEREQPIYHNKIGTIAESPTNSIEANNKQPINDQPKYSNSENVLNSSLRKSSAILGARMMSSSQKRVSFVNENDRPVLQSHPSETNLAKITSGITKPIIKSKSPVTTLLEDGSYPTKSSQIQLKPLLLNNYKQKPPPKLDALYTDSTNQPAVSHSIQMYRQNTNLLEKTNTDDTSTSISKSTHLNPIVNSDAASSYAKLQQSLISKRSDTFTNPSISTSIVNTNKLDALKNNIGSASILKPYQHPIINRNLENEKPTHSIEISRIYSASHSKINKPFSISANDLSSTQGAINSSTKTLKLPPVVTNNQINSENTILIAGSTNNINSIGLNDALGGKKKVNDLSRYCYFCKKKTGLASSYICRCGNNYCTQHRNAESHNCTYDYKTEGRKLIEHSNPLVAAPKLPKI